MTVKGHSNFSFGSPLILASTSPAFLIYINPPFQDEVWLDPVNNPEPYLFLISSPSSSGVIMSIFSFLHASFPQEISTTFWLPSIFGRPL